MNSVPVTAVLESGVRVIRGKAVRQQLRTRIATTASRTMGRHIMGFKRIVCFVLALALLVPAAAVFAGPALADEHPSTTWYLAEGSTGESAAGYFETFVLVSNPQTGAAVVTLFHQLETPDPATGGDWPGATFSLPAHTRLTVNVADSLAAGSPGAPGHTWSVSTRVESDRQVVAERAVYWTSRAVMDNGGITRQAATECIGVTSPNTSWFLSEGSTHNGSDGHFETWVLVQNPGDVTSDVTLTYQTPSSSVPGPHFTLARHSRRSISIAEMLPGEDSVSTQVNATSPVVVERAMYWSNPTCERIAAHDSVGATTTSLSHYMPMASVAYQDVGYSHYETYILVQNPNDVAAHVTLSLIPEVTGHPGPVTGPAATVAPHTRHTFNLAAYKDAIGSSWFGVVIGSDQRIAAEKAMYVSNNDPYYTLSVDRMAAFGSNSLESAWTRWVLAEGSTGQYPTGDFHTFIAIINPGTVEAQVQVSYDTPGGMITGPAVLVPASTLRVVNVSDTLPNEASVSTRLDSTQQVASERFMIWVTKMTAPTGVKVGWWAGTTSVGVPFLPL